MMLASSLTSDVVLSGVSSSLFLDTEKAFDIAPREALLDHAFGPGRFGKTCQRLRDDRLPAEGLSFAARCGDRLVGTVRLWHVDAGGVPALMLGPLAVDPAFRAQGLGRALMEVGLAQAASLGHKAVLLVGDAPYYARFGFEARLAASLTLPGPVERARFLALELVPGTLLAAKGMVRATGAIPLKREARDGHRRHAA